MISPPSQPASGFPASCTTAGVIIVVRPLQLLGAVPALTKIKGKLYVNVPPEQGEAVVRTLLSGGSALTAPSSELAGPSTKST